MLISNYQSIKMTVDPEKNDSMTLTTDVQNQIGTSCDN